MAGTVIAADTGMPLAKAVLTFRALGAEAQPRYALTDSSGRFEIKGLDPGRYSLSASHAGYVRMQYDQRSPDSPGTVLTLRPGQAVKDISFRLPRAAAVSGHIYDEDGNPIEHAQVHAMSYRYFRGSRQLLPVGFATTDDRGEYRIFDLAPGQYYVSASFNAGQFGQGPASLSYPETFYPSTTDSSGATPIQLAAGDDLPGVDISLTPTPTFHIRGKVFNAVSNRPGEGVMVFLLPRGGSLTNVFSFTGQNYVRNHQGEFDLAGVRPGSYFLIARSVSNGTELQTRVPVDVTNADVNGLSVTLTPGIDIQGQVRTAGGKLDLSGVRLFLQPRDQSIYFSSETDSPDRNGNVVFHHVGDGGYKLEVWGLPPDAYVKSILLNGQDVRVDGFDVNEGQNPGMLEIVIDSNGGRVSGTVLRDDKPFNNAQVVLLPEGGKVAKDSDLTKETTTDQYGVFVIRGIRPGTYRVMAFEQIEEDAWTDPNFISRLKDQGTEVEVDDGTACNVQLQVIPASKTTSAE
ncbi:MAG TPA: carboxypeptidase-like regulatory domain-containing protein, partial [Terriglobia bacterium]|nr:carboxypeptidase-like regulatory domain-containing protein [Terriglobia bacterium]